MHTRKERPEVIQGFPLNRRRIIFAVTILYFVLNYISYHYSHASFNCNEIALRAEWLSGVIEALILIGNFFFFLFSRGLSTTDIKNYPDPHRIRQRISGYTIA